MIRFPRMLGAVLLICSSLIIIGCLGKEREKAYLQDKAIIQTAIDSYFTWVDNVRYQGQRQFPIMSATNSSGRVELPNTVRTATVLFDESGAAGTLSSPINPLRGLSGGDPKWRDGENDGTRKLGSDGTPLPVGQIRSEEALNNAKAALTNTKEAGWFVNQVSFQREAFAVDSRD